MKGKLKAGAGMLVFLLLAVAVGPFFVTDPAAIDLGATLLSPSESGLLGTDHLGRDVFSRLIHGGQLSVVLTLVTLSLSLIFGLALGIAAGYFGGICDVVVNYLINLLLAFPSMILALAIVALAGGGMANAVIAICLVSWVGYARLARGMCLSLRERDCVKAAQLSGSSGCGILVRHILPNLKNPVIIYSATLSSTIFLQFAGLSFLGLGAEPPTAEWGLMLDEARGYLTEAPWLTMAPVAGIIFLTIACNLFGEGLTEHFGKERSS